MNRPLRLIDVAKAAGVSRSTASNVFARPDLVRPTVRAHVEDVARTLGYAGPDPKGRLLRAGRVNAIGVVLGEGLTEFFADPYNQEFMSGITEACDERGAGVSLISAKQEQALRWNIDSALVDGLVLMCMAGDTRLVELAHRRGLPFVATDTDPGPEFSSVLIDDRGGARLAAEHLIGLGHRNIGVLSLEGADDGKVGFADPARRASWEYRNTRERMLGYDGAFAAAGIPPEGITVVESLNVPDAARSMAALLFDRSPDLTAVLAMSDVLAIAAIREAGRRGLKVPEDLSIVGFDDIPAAATSSPPLTTVHQPIAEKGRRAARMIFAGDRPQREVLPVELVVRESTARPRR
jgi:DNA-binding LacI/PurR family transcriptional regulator